MIDINDLRRRPDYYKGATKAKGINPDVVDEALRFDRERKELLVEVEKLRAKRNKLTKNDIEKGRELKAQLQNIEPQLVRANSNFNELLIRIPNPPAKDVKTGKDETENEVIRKWGEQKAYDFQVKDHVELGEALDLVDIKRASKVSGSRFAYLLNDAVRIEFALIQFALETFIKKGFTPVLPPIMISQKAMAGMGYMEHGGAEDMYLFDKDGMVLVGTSEQSIGPMHENEVFEMDSLPVKYVSFSTCFRREAGSYGKDTRGILRVHQFDKVELFVFAVPDESEKIHELLLEYEEELFQKLQIPYRVIKMCSGDLGAPASKKYDIEAWIPSQNKYREVTSTSNCTDFQSRRLNIKYRNKNEFNYVHTLNGTAVAIGRTLIAIMENYQQKDGSIAIPKVLQAYVGKKKIISPRRKL
jgi:seryl-tRNA synthetase